MTREHLIHLTCPDCGGDLEQPADGPVFYECSGCGQAFGYKDLLLAGKKTQVSIEDFGGVPDGT